jgi:4-amino-4-deoxy-L-arabinose transferase-like glycosyltransferase
MRKKLFSNIVIIIILFLSICLVMHLTCNAQIYGSDPGKVFNRAKIFLDQGYQESFKLLMPPGTIVLYSIFMGVFDYEYPLLLIQGIAFILLALLIYNFINYYLNNQPVAILSVILLFSSGILINMVYWLPAYVTSLFLTILAIYLFFKYSRKNNKFIYLSAFFMASAAYFHNLFIITSLIPAIYYLLSANKNVFKMDCLKPIIRFYVVYGLVYLPWFMYCFNIAGFDFYKAPYTWMQIKYWPEFNLSLLNRPETCSIEYFQYFIEHLDRLVPFYFVFPFILIGLFKSGHRGRLYVAWIFVSIVPVLFGIVPTNMRYLILLIPVLILLTCEGLIFLYKNFNKKLYALILFFLIIGAVFAIHTHLSLYNNRQSMNTNQITQFETFKNYTNDGENIYFRSHVIQPFFPENRVYETVELDEEDAINFITWTSDEDVKDIMMKYGIRWIILYEPKEEKRLQSWVRLLNKEPKHYRMIENSSCFSKRCQTRNFILYEITV